MRDPWNSVNIVAAADDPDSEGDAASRLAPATALGQPQRTVQGVLVTEYA